MNKIAQRIARRALERTTAYDVIDCNVFLSDWSRRELEAQGWTAEEIDALDTMFRDAARAAARGDI